MKMNPTTVGVLLGAALLAAGVYYVKKKGGLTGAVAGVAAGAVNAAGQVATGTVLGIGDAVGLPRTNAALCRQYLDAGDYLNASFYCPASDFIGASADAVAAPAQAIVNTSGSAAGSILPDGLDSTALAGVG